MLIDFWFDFIHATGNSYVTCNNFTKIEIELIIQNNTALIDHSLGS
jgi:hypothetical protein